MTRTLKLSFYTALLFSLGLAAFAIGESNDKPQAIGRYDRGSLKNAETFPADGLGFLQIFRVRDHVYTTTYMSEALRWVAYRMTLLYPGKERLQVVDIACQGGGRCPGHGSHQNGLDADLIYFRNDLRETVDRHDPKQVIEEDFAEDRPDSTYVHPNFDTQRNLDLAREFVATGRVARIFTNWALKGAMCVWAKENGRMEEYASTLRKLRPLRNHHDHYHLRLICPAGSPQCVAEKEVPPGDGCDSILARKVKRGRAGGLSSLGSAESTLAFQALREPLELDEVDLRHEADEDHGAHE